VESPHLIEQCGTIFNKMLRRKHYRDQNLRAEPKTRLQSPRTMAESTTTDQGKHKTIEGRTQGSPRISDKGGHKDDQTLRTEARGIETPATTHERMLPMPQAEEDVGEVGGEAGPGETAAAAEAEEAEEVDTPVAGKAEETKTREAARP